MTTSPSSNQGSAELAGGRRPILEARAVKLWFRAKQRSRRTHTWIRAVDDVSIVVERGEILGVVGETGSGKTTLGQVLVGLLRPLQGEVIYDGAAVFTPRGTVQREISRQIQMVFQDTRGALNPRMRIRDIIREGLVVQKLGKAREQRDRVMAVAASVGLGPRHLDRYPHELSGGQRQRVGIARALAPGPRVLVADEPVSGLDVSIQAQVINLLLDLRDQLDLSYVFISHDLSVVERISDRVAVMYMGRLMELGSAAQLFARPQVPYTYALLAARPEIRAEHRQARVVLPAGSAQRIYGGRGCPFVGRCWRAEDVCRISVPEIREIERGHWAACHFAGDLRVPTTPGAG